MKNLMPRKRVDGYFFDELKLYVGFDEDAQLALSSCLPIVEPHFEAVVASFYEALNQNPRVSAVFDGPEQVERLHQTLLNWLKEGFTGPWHHEFYERRRRIGRVHVDVGLLPHFMGGAMNIVRRHLLRVLLQAEATLDQIEATERLLDLELAIMHQSYWDHLMELKLTLPVALASGLAHEIRNPLNAIGLNLKILERRLEALGSPDTIPVVETVRSEVRRISDLTREILDFARPVELNCVWHRCDRFLQDIETMYASSFEAAGVLLVTETTGEAYCYCDIDRMRQVVVNLLTNAVEAIDGPGTVTVGVVTTPGVTTLTVADTGHGMEPALAYQIFDLFFTQKASGTGLGLPIVKHIVDAHGGTIDVTTRPNQGTTFTIRLPRPTPPTGAAP